VNNSARGRRVAVSADGRGLVSQAGAVLLWETMRVTGLGRGLSAALEQWRAPRAAHDPGKIVADLAAAVVLGGDCLADIAVLREQPELAGPVASDPVVSRLVSTLAADLPAALAGIRAARAAARERAWALAGDAAPGAGGGLVTIDLDATILMLEVCTEWQPDLSACERNIPKFISNYRISTAEMIDAMRVCELDRKSVV